MKKDCGSFEDLLDHMVGGIVAWVGLQNVIGLYLKTWWFDAVGLYKGYNKNCVVF